MVPVGPVIVLIESTAILFTMPSCEGFNDQKVLDDGRSCSDTSDDQHEAQSRLRDI